MDNTNTGNKFGNRRSSEQGSHLPDLSVAHYYVTRSTCARTLEPLPEIVEDTMPSTLNPRRSISGVEHLTILSAFTDKMTSSPDKTTKSLSKTMGKMASSVGRMTSSMASSAGKMTSSMDKMTLSMDKIGHMGTSPKDSQCDLDSLSPAETPLGVAMASRRRSKRGVTSWSNVLQGQGRSRRRSSSKGRDSIDGSSDDGHYDKSFSSQKMAAAYRRRVSSERKVKLMQIFRRAVKLTIFCRRQTVAHILRNKVFDEISPYISTLHFSEYSRDSEVDLLFDPRKFKADRQLRISDEAKRILCKPPVSRTESELHYVQIFMRNLKSFSEYPVRMQVKIVQEGQYERFNGKRVIVRQGHPATAFYLILSGSVVVMVYEDEARVAKPVAYLTRGMAFGELAIINSTPRQSTIVTKEAVELLSLDIKAFRRIFMAGGARNINDPDHNQFIKSLGFLTGWPLDEMNRNPKQCIFHFFKRGEVLVKDSKYSDWIYIVKSGSLRVLKKLKRVDPFEAKTKRDAVVPPKTAKQLHYEERQLMMERRHVLPELAIPLKPQEAVKQTSAMQDETLTLPLVTRSEHAGTPDSRLNEILGRLNRGVSDMTPDKQRSRSNRAVSAVVEITGDLEDEDKEVEDRNKENDQPESMYLATSCLLNNPATPETGSRTSLLMTPLNRNGTPRTLSPPPEVRLASGQRRRDSSKRLCGKQKKGRTRDEFSKETGRSNQRIRTIADDFDASGRNPDVITEADLDPQFVNIQILQKGDVFGIVQAVLGDQASFCVVSNGAECILIDKKLYTDHASDHLLRHLRQQCCPYPSEDELQEGLQTSVDWQAFKKTTVHDTYRSLREKKKRKRSPVSYRSS